MSRRRIVLLISCIAVGALALGIRAFLVTHDAHAKEPAAAPTVRVVLAAVEKRDVPVWFDGLGVIAAWQQVTVKAQVDGRLETVGFHEGQAVKKGSSATGHSSPRSSSRSSRPTIKPLRWRRPRARSRPTGPPSRPRG